MKRAITTLTILIGLSGTGAAAVFDLGGTQTFGTQHYVGTKVYGRWKDGEYSVRPSYSQYHDDFSSGTYKTLAARGAYDTKRYGFGASVGGTPVVDGYSNFFFGADGILHLRPQGGGAGMGERGEKSAGKEELLIDLGGSLTETIHRDQFQTGSVRRPNGSAAIGETDVGVSGAAEIFDNYARLEIVKSVYSSDLADVSARGPRGRFLPGLDAAEQGFPSTVTSLRYELEALPVVIPYAVYTHTSFALGEADSNALKLGSYAEFEVVTLEASFEHLAQKGQPSRNFYSLGGSVRF